MDTVVEFVRRDLKKKASTRARESGKTFFKEDVML